MSCPVYFLAETLGLRKFSMGTIKGQGVVMTSDKRRLMVREGRLEGIKLYTGEKFIHIFYCIELVPLRQEPIVYTSHK